MDPVRVAVWGVGRHAEKNLLPALRACPSTTLVGVSTRTPGDYGCTYWPDPDQMLAADVDAVLVATPVGLHAAQGLRVLAAGKHLWCEKSLVAHHDAFERLAEVAGELCVCEAFMYEHHPQLAAILDHLPALGAVRTLTARFGLPPLAEPGYRFDPALGGSALLDVGCYPLSLAQHLLGELEILACRLRREGGVDREGLALLRSADGAHVVLDWGYDRAYRNEVEIWGERGSLYTDRVFSKPADFAPTITLRSLTGQLTEHPVPAANHFVAMVEAFARATRDPALRRTLMARAERQSALLTRLLAWASAR